MRKRRVFRLKEPWPPISRDPVDLLLLDGAKALYRDVLALLEGRLRPGVLVIADNADHSPEYLAYVRAPGSGFLSFPFAGDVDVSLKVG